MQSGFEFESPWESLAEIFLPTLSRLIDDNLAAPYFYEIQSKFAF